MEPERNHRSLSIIPPLRDRSGRVDLKCGVQNYLCRPGHGAFDILSLASPKFLGPEHRQLRLKE